MYVISALDLVIFVVLGILALLLLIYAGVQIMFVRVKSPLPSVLVRYSCIFFCLRAVNHSELSRQLHIRK